MEKSADILIWLILPLLLLLPLAVHAETVRCKTELRRLCDSVQVCTRTTEIHPSIEYIIDLKEDRSSARITKLVGGKRMANWKALNAPTPTSTDHEYAAPKERNGRFSLSKNFVTFSYSVAERIGKDAGQANEVGLCLTGTP